MAINLKGSDLRMAFAKMRGCLVEGLTEDQMCERFGLSWDDVDEIRRQCLDEEAEVIRHRSTEHTYVQYCLEMRRCIDDLEKVGIDYIDSKDSEDGTTAKVNVSGYVGAVRARADIIDRIIKTGQDFGLIERKNDGKGFAAGEAIKEMSNPEFKKYILQEINIFNTMQLKFGDKSFTELDPGPLYQATISQKFPVRKVQGHTRGKVFGGRRVVKGEGGGATS